MVQRCPKGRPDSLFSCSFVWLEMKVVEVPRVMVRRDCRGGGGGEGYRGGSQGRVAGLLGPEGRQDGGWKEA